MNDIYSPVFFGPINSILNAISGVPVTRDDLKVDESTITVVSKRLLSREAIRSFDENWPI